MQVSSKDCTIISQEILEAVIPILNKHGFDTNALKRSSGYGDRFSIKIDAFRKSNSNSEVNENTEYARTFNMFATFYGVNPEALGRDFIMNGESFKIMGLNRRARKSPFIIKSNVSGKEYRCGESPIKLNFPKDKELPKLESEAKEPSDLSKFEKVIKSKLGMIAEEDESEGYTAGNTYSKGNSSFLKEVIRFDKIENNKVIGFTFCLMFLSAKKATKRGVKKTFNTNQIKEFEAWLAKHNVKGDAK